MDKKCRAIRVVRVYDTYSLLCLKCSQIIQPSKDKIPSVFLTTEEDIIQKDALKKPDFADELN